MQTAFVAPITPRLHGIRIVSLALNLPGPAALMRLRAWGADCVKFEPPAAPGMIFGDPCAQLNNSFYTELHDGVDVRVLDLKRPGSRDELHDELTRTDVLLTSFRRRALHKLGLDWISLHARHPRLCMVSIYGATGERADEAGHDLTYQAEAGLIQGQHMPTSVFADMGGSLMASEAVLGVLLARFQQQEGCHAEVALNLAAQWLALPLHRGLLDPQGLLGGAHAGYRIYPCRDGRVALGAVEQHFATRLCEVSGVRYEDQRTLFAPATHEAVGAFMAAHTCNELAAIGAERDIPVHALPNR